MSNPKRMMFRDDVEYVKKLIVHPSGLGDLFSEGNGNLILKSPVTTFTLAGIELFYLEEAPRIALLIEDAEGVGIGTPLEDMPAADPIWFHRFDARTLDSWEGSAQ